MNHLRNMARSVTEGTKVELTPSSLLQPKEVIHNHIFFAALLEMAQRMRADVCSGGEETIRKNCWKACKKSLEANLPQVKREPPARDQAASVVGVSGKMRSRQIHFLHNNSNAIQCEQFKRLKIILAKYHILILQSRRTDLSLIKTINIFNYLEFLEMKNANLLKPEEAAKLLGISRNTFSLMIAKNQLPAPAMIGNRKFWPKKELEKWISSGCKKPSNND